MWGYAIRKTVTWKPPFVCAQHPFPNTILCITLQVRTVKSVFIIIFISTFIAGFPKRTLPFSFTDRNLNFTVLKSHVTTRSSVCTTTSNLMWDGYHVSSLLQSALQPFIGFWPAQVSLSLLSRKVFTECCCQQHVKPPTWRTSD